jgi:hypothetical protein
MAANPAGLGYALENRIVMSRVFPKLYHQTQIRRLAPFFHTFHHSLIRRASLRREDPGIVLLSPGPDSRIYFEHALLSRYLGYPLVEGQDLTVRNGKVFLKKLAGLEPVEAIFRTGGGRQQRSLCPATGNSIRRGRTHPGLPGTEHRHCQSHRQRVRGYAGPVGFPARLCQQLMEKTCCWQTTRPGGAATPMDSTTSWPI